MNVMIRFNVEYCSPARAHHYQQDEDLVTYSEGNIITPSYFKGCLVTYGNYNTLKRLQQPELWTLGERLNHADLSLQDGDWSQWPVVC